MMPTGGRGPHGRSWSGFRHPTGIIAIPATQTPRTSFIGRALSDSLFDDTLNGGGGDDTIYDGTSGDTDTLDGGAGNDIFRLNGGIGASGTVNGGTETDTVRSTNLGNYGFTDVETLDTNSVNATVEQLSSFANIIDSNSPSTQIQFFLRGEGGTIDFSSRVTGTDSVSVSNSGVTSGYTVTGSANGDILVGSQYNDTLNGGGGDDTISDYTGVDTDTLDGGAGNDIFVLAGGSAANGTVNGGTESDTVKSQDLGGYSFTDVETLDTNIVRATVEQLSSIESIIDSGSTSTQIQFGLHGAGGTIDFSSRVTGTDSVRVVNSGVTSGYTVTGSANADYLYDSQFDDTLNGGGGDDNIYDGTDGDTDTLNGGAGNDTFQITGGSGASGTVNGGTESDTVRSYDLGNYGFTDVETLDTLYVVATTAQLSSFASIISSDFPNTQIQFALRGAGGTIDFSSRVTGAGSVWVSDYGVTSGYTVTGSANGDFLNGSVFNDTLNGGGGADNLAGYDGNDSYIVDNASDIVFEAGGQGTDTVSAVVSYTLLAEQSVEVLNTASAAGTTAINLTGNELVQAITGNAGNNILNGGAGADSLTGLDGNDTYIVDNAGDRVIEAAGQGTDTVSTSVSWVLAAGQSVEAVSLSPATGLTALNLTGNEQAQSLTGNAGNNLLNGGADADSLYGLGGNDSYYVDNAGDLVFETVGLGTDTVYASTSWALGAGQSVEAIVLNPRLGNAALNLTGNELAQSLYGNAGNNTLDGGGGADNLTGYDGNDSYIVDNAGDRVIEAAEQGTDTITSSISWVLAAGLSVEAVSLSPATGITALNLTGNELAQSLTGNAGNNLLDGGAGADSLTGLDGNDTYIVDNAGDRVIEAVGQGTDTITSSISWVLAAGLSVEAVSLSPATGLTALNLTGNEQAQSLTGNAGNNLLNGAAGADSLYGLGGNDSYYVDNAGDLVFEAAGLGSDTVYASASWTLGAGQSVEAIVLNPRLGNSDLNLTGNELAQSLYGNAGNNILNGGGGADNLTGYGGNDTFLFDAGLGAANVVRITDFSSVDDTIQLDQTVFTELGLGTLNATAYKDISGGAAVDADDRILYDQSTGSVFYDTNGSDAGERYLIATLNNKPATLTNADFFVVA